MVPNCGLKAEGALRHLSMRNGAIRLAQSLRWDDTGLRRVGAVGYDGTGNVRDHHIETRLIPSGTHDHHVALHRVFDVKAPPPGAAPAPPVADLLASVRRNVASIDLLVGAYRGDELVSACLGVASPGAAAMVFASKDVAPTRKYRASVEALRALQTLAWQRSIKLLEALVAPQARTFGEVLRDAGFRYLTCLAYLKRACMSVPASSHKAADLEWVTYAPQRESLFAEAVEATYAQSLDCPELTGLRETAEVLAGHRASGVFDPAFWWVALRDGKAVGVLLLSRIPREPALEVVYMGVIRASRGTGVGDALLQRAVEASLNADVKILALAVDHRNTPARRLYARWDFVETVARDAWIASSPRI